MKPVTESVRKLSDSQKDSRSFKDEDYEPYASLKPAKPQDSQASQQYQ